MITEKITVTNSLGIHARPSTLIVRNASKFKSKVSLKRLDSNIVADAKSIMYVMMLTAICGTEIEITAEGPDEKEAVETLVNLFNSGFGECYG